jgi:hypothetical protein
MKEKPLRGLVVSTPAGEMHRELTQALGPCRDTRSVSTSTRWYRKSTGQRDRLSYAHTLSLTSRMVAWKHYIILFGGFIDVGIKSLDFLPRMALDTEQPLSVSYFQSPADNPRDLCNGGRWSALDWHTRRLSSEWPERGDHEK